MNFNQGSKIIVNRKLYKEFIALGSTKNSIKYCPKCRTKTLKEIKQTLSWVSSYKFKCSKCFITWSIGY